MRLIARLTLLEANQPISAAHGGSPRGYGEERAPEVWEPCCFRRGILRAPEPCSRSQQRSSRTDACAGRGDSPQCRLLPKLPELLRPSPQQTSRAKKSSRRPSSAMPGRQNRPHPSRRRSVTGHGRRAWTPQTLRCGSAITLHHWRQKPPLNPTARCEVPRR